MTPRPTLDTCITCAARCCRHVALQIDRPSCKRDYDQIRWYLMHANVSVFIDHDGDWLLEFSTPCASLRDDNGCAGYRGRPDVCRSYPAPDDDCEYLGSGKPHRVCFRSAEQFERYLTRKGVAWRRKRGMGG